MNEVAFVEKREPDWKRLSYLCDKADNTLKALTPDEFQEFVRLYRRVSTDLALVRTKSSNIQLIAFLNDLVGRSYGVLYRAPRQPILKAVQSFIALAAQTVRRRRWFLALGAGILAGSAVLAFFLLRVAPDTREELIPPGPMAEQFRKWQEGGFEAHTASQSSFMSMFYVSHNPLVAIITGATSASTFGLGSAYYTYENGIMLGSLTHEMADVGKTGFLYGSIMPHGVTELSGAIVSCAAGFVMGGALINPGRRKRAQALKEAGKDAIVLLSTSVILMFMAAPIEGFFSFNPKIPMGFKIAFAIASAIFWAVFWIGYGKSPAELGIQDVQGSA